MVVGKGLKACGLTLKICAEEKLLKDMEKVPSEELQKNVVLFRFKYFLESPS